MHETESVMLVKARTCPANTQHSNDKFQNKAGSLSEKTAGCQ